MENLGGASPIQRAVWDADFPISLFQPQIVVTPVAVRAVMDRSVAVWLRHREQRTTWGEDGKPSAQVLRDLGDVGFWGLLVEPRYGGVGATLPSFVKFVTYLAEMEPALAGLASVHGCIGAANSVGAYGSEEQKKRLLPALASGERLSAFALTEPGAGSDLTALRTAANRDGDEFVIDGEKVFITNAAPGRTIGLVCMIDGKPAVLVCELPWEENERFQLRSYGMHPLRHTPNKGFLFRGFRVPAANLLQSPSGSGLTIAYHGLNRGRVALCATAAGNLRRMLGSLVPWVKYRSTYGAAIGERELVRRRIGRLAGLIVACDALANWCSGLLEQGFRGEMECIVAKIFASEAQKEAAIELLMKTHGGRSFLHGHLFGDNVQEFLVPCIYEGEGEMLGLAFFKSLTKQFGANSVEPLRAPQRPTLPPMPESLRVAAEFAAMELQQTRDEIRHALQKHSSKLADRQCRMIELASRVQKMTVILTTASDAAQQENELIRQAAAVICRDLTRELTGERPTDQDFQDVVALGEAVIEGGYRTWVNFEPEAILFPYLS